MSVMFKRLLVTFASVYLIFGVLNEASSSELALTTTTPVVTEGDMLAVELIVSGLGDGVAPSLGGFDIDVTFDQSLLSFSDYALGPFLGDLGSGEAIDFSLGNVVFGTVNVAEVSLLFFPGELDSLQSDSFTLATMEFAADVVGDSTMSISFALLSDAFGEDLDIEATSDLSITIEPRVAISEPSPIGIVGLGIVMLMLMSHVRKRRRRRERLIA